MIWCGAASAGGSVVALVVVAVILVAVYVHRMRAEEAMLVQTFGADYRAYHARSRRLVPWLY